jgi:hypothetical protein
LDIVELPSVLLDIVLVLSVPGVIGLFEPVVSVVPMLEVVGLEFTAGFDVLDVELGMLGVRDVEPGTLGVVDVELGTLGVSMVVLPDEVAGVVAGVVMGVDGGVVAEF